MKLSELQEQIITLMQQGYDLQTSYKNQKFVAWLQHQDGTQKKVHLGSLWALADIGFIDVEQETHPITTWHLTTSGKNYTPNS